MSRLLCCLCAPVANMGAALSHPQEGDICDGVGGPPAPPTMADVIRERKKKAGGAALGTLRRRLAAATRRPRDSQPDRGCEHGRYIRSVVGDWQLPEVVVLCEEMEAGAALRDLLTQAELAREPAPALHADLAALLHDACWCDVELIGAGWSLAAHRAVLAARSHYFRDLLRGRPPGFCRVPLEGAGASLSREELVAGVRMLYSGPLYCHTCHKYERSGGAEADEAECGAGCGCAGGAARRLAAALGCVPDALLRDVRRLLDSGELCDARLVWAGEGARGPDLPCHRFILAARSRFFRNVMGRRTSSNGAICVDEKILPRRFAKALLHAAYTDQIDLSLIGRSGSSPSSSSGGGGMSSWPGAARSSAPRPVAPRPAAPALDDVFQLYEIASFVEMPIAVQGCEDAIVEALSADTLPLVLRWAAAPHASKWVHRQAMRYLRDEFPRVTSGAAAGRLPRAALRAALQSPFLQASEPQALRGLLRWAAAQPAQPPEPNLVWHTAHSASRRGTRRRELGDAALRESVAALVPLVRVEHIPPDHEVLAQLVRRGVLPARARPPGGAADAWLGRGAHRPARCFLPYLDELRALLEDQAVPEAEVARIRRERYMHRIPDTLYMVAAARGESPPGGAEGAAGGAEGGAAQCVGARRLAALRARARELAARAAPLHHHAHHADMLYRQIALRAVREMSLPDSCADLLISDIENECNGGGGGERSGPEPRRAPARAPRTHDPDSDCCRRSGPERCPPAGSPRAAHPAPLEGRADRRETQPRPPDCRSGSGRLSAAVPDVAMAPNANTHLLTNRDYFRPPLPAEYGGAVLQLDLGDGATHTPRPGSRAQRAHAAAQLARGHAPAAARARLSAEEHRAAVEMSMIRAYSALEYGSPQTRQLRRNQAGTLRQRQDAPGFAPSSPPPGSRHPLYSFRNREIEFMTEAAYAPPGCRDHSPSNFA